MRIGVAAEYGFALYRAYSEEQAAHYCQRDVSTMKRNRQKGLYPHVRHPGGGIRYLGIHIADIILFGEGAIKGYRDDGEAA